MSSFRLTTFALCIGVAASSAAAFDATFEISGDDKDTKRAIRAASALAIADNDDVTRPDEIIAAAQADYRNIVGSLYREGYYGPSVSIRVDGREAADMSLISLPASVGNVVITVDPGPRFRFGKTIVAPLAPNTVLPTEFAAGAIARAPVVGEAKDAAVSGWRAVSYAKARLADQSIVADHPNKELDVALAIDPGPEVRFGKLSFSGDTGVRENHLRRMANLPEGKAFDPDALLRVSRRLQRTGTFRSVTVREAETLNPDDTLDITVLLEEAEPRRFGFGAEVSSLEGGAVTAYWMHRNITNRADRLRFDASISGIGGNTGVDYRLATTYRRPATPTRKTTLVLGIEVAQTEDPTYFEKSGQFTVGAEVETDAFSNFEFAIGYRYSEVQDDLGTRRFRHVIFPIEGYRDERDDSLDATSGYYYAAEITPFIGVDGSASGTRVHADGRTYFSFGTDDRFTLAGRLQLGAIFGAEGADVPPEMLFFSGGGGTVRGQPYKSLGVDLGGGIEIGGTGFIGLSTELRAGISEKIEVVGFYDIGGIGPDLPGENAEWHSGAGLGLRYDTGFGPIRLDVAAPVSGDTGSGVQFYIGIGQAF
ncbi:autotransporter assembly complex family protein [Celeribacter arenosi]|uniref:Autotransporter assembly complex family protein n=1 Tax=Celeribacter arenosi TaxID=792649 RepID=A0ABP7K8F8_9RHOB